jgi:GNAT superfamily N-acetyltransferase
MSKSVDLGEFQVWNRRFKKPAMRIGPLYRRTFLRSESSDPADSFFRSFRSKADMMDLWPCTGAYDLGTGELLGAVSMTLSAREPRTANLQLLFTFARSRNRGVGKTLCQACLAVLRGIGADYFRVSSEPESRGFYERIGIRFVGEQKSGTYLSFGRVLTGRKLTAWSGIRWGDLSDPVVDRAVNRKGKGGCVSLLGNEKTPPVRKGLS